MKKYLLDTNILLRFLLGDHDELSPPSGPPVSAGRRPGMASDSHRP